METLAGIVERYDTIRTRAFSRCDSLCIASKIACAFGMAALTGVAAQVRFHLPGTPVPVTGQVFAVLLAGVLLGGGYGALSQVFYLGLGYAGLPWFTGFFAGSAALLGFTGGYLIGFVPAALFIGLAVRHTQRRIMRPLVLPLVMLLAVGIIYFFGALQFAAFTGAGLHDTFAFAVAPFILWDIAKAALAGFLACAILPGK